MDDPHVLKPNAALAPACLAFVAGFADAASFVGADGIFCAHVTGNFVVLAADLARGASADEWLKLATFPIFVAAVLAATSLHTRRKGGAAGPSLLASAGLFAAAAIVAALWSTAAPGPARSAVVALLVVAMGAQNALHRLNPGLGPMTTVMTGNVTGWLVETIVPGPPGAASKHRTVGAVIAAFAAGCAAGALGVARGGFVTLVVPAALLLFVRWRLPSPGAGAPPGAAVAPPAAAAAPGAGAPPAAAAPGAGASPAAAPPPVAEGGPQPAGRGPKLS